MSCSKLIQSRVLTQAARRTARHLIGGSIVSSRSIAAALTRNATLTRSTLTHPAAAAGVRRFASAADQAPIQYLDRPPPPELAKNAYIGSFAEYQRLYDRSLNDSDNFWREMANENITWSKPFTTIKTGEDAVNAKWFEDGKLNACYNCVDRHVAKRGNKTAILWESDDGKEVRHITYSELHVEVQRVANVLKSLGGGKHTKATIYMPMVPEAAITMLACARIGMPHNVVFAGFSEDSLRDRINFSDSKLVITSNELMRNGKPLGLKKIVDAAVKQCPHVEKVLVVKRTETPTEMTAGRDVWWHEAIEQASPVCPVEEMNSEDPLFCLFTSGSTGKPKGLIHTTGGFMTYAAVTTKYAFDIKESDVYACTADIGWITGHTYMVYGPLALGTTTFLFEGHPSHPHNGRFWELVEKHKLTIFYTSPTAVRSLMRFGDEPVKKFDRSSLRILGSVGEPINPEAWEWLYQTVGDHRCPIIDTYWQTESGGILFSPLPGATTLKAGSCTFPFFGIEPALVDPVTHAELPATPGKDTTGALVVKRPWPGLARTVLGDHKRYKETYFSSKEQPEAYVTGDSARRDADGYWWIIGRMDDVINVSGHRIGSAEVESAIVTHPLASESAVVSMPHPVKGECLFAFVSLKHGEHAGPNFEKEVKDIVAREIGKLAIPDFILPAEALPKTRSGKIMRRLLRQLVLKKTDAASLGDTSTLLDPHVVDVLKHSVADLLAAAEKAKK